METNSCRQINIHFYPFKIGDESAGLIEICLLNHIGEIQSKDCFMTEDAQAAGIYIRKKYIDNRELCLEKTTWKQKADGMEIIFTEGADCHVSILSTQK